MESSSKHLFALFYQASIDWHSISPLSTVTITDESIVHRAYHVLRLGPDDQIILFNKQYHFLLTLITLSKKEIKATITQANKNTVYQPSITVALPLLKRDALTYALDGLTQLGINTIQLITTQKSQSQFSQQKDMQRLYKIIYAAAEQSKNFSFPELIKPVPLSDFITDYNTQKKRIIFGDPAGLPAHEVISSLQQNNTTPITIIMGPEGDLTVNEKSLLKQHSVMYMALTPTILRAEQAICLASGMVRALMQP